MKTWIVQHWPHGTPLPPGAKHLDGAAMSDHHRYHSSIIEHDAAYIVAREHVTWCRSRGMTKRTICGELGIDPATVKTIEDLVCAVAALWLALDKPSDD